MGVLLGPALLALVACVSATPVERRQTAMQNFHLPTSFAALGDSFSAGIGSGKFLTSSADGSDNACGRMDGSYPWQLFNLKPFEEPLESFPDFYSCSGDIMDNIDGQVAKLNGKKVDAITLSISGNDFKFGDVVRRCVYPYRLSGTGPEQMCDDALVAAQNAINDQSNWDKYLSKVQLIQSNALNPGGSLFITGYAKFFATPQQGDKCDETYFFPITFLQVLTMQYVTRVRMNDLVNQVNERIQEDVVGEAGSNTFFIDIDKVFEGKRFCEPANDDDPIGSDNPHVWFNDLKTTLEETGPYNPASTDNEANSWTLWASDLPSNITDDPNYTGRGILDKLQQNSAFHPKKDAHRVTCAEIFWKILLGAPTNEVTLGPSQYCEGLSPGGSGDCFDIPAGCGIINPSYNYLPTIVCQNGTSYTA